MSLNDTKVKNTRPKEKSFKLSDGGGMFLLINSNGSKYWRMKYRFNGGEKSLAIGVYPTVTLKGARIAREIAKTQLSDGIYPGVEEKLSCLVVAL